jgi:hypothetical protein
MILSRPDRGPGTGDPDKRGIGAAGGWPVAGRSPDTRPSHDHTRVPGPGSQVPSPR